MGEGRMLNTKLGLRARPSNQTKKEKSTVISEVTRPKAIKKKKKR